MYEHTRQKWAELKDPKTNESLYINLKSGTLKWAPPPGDEISSINEKQWWELYDSQTSKYYYHNALLKKTVWYRPENVDIIPLAKLQTKGLTNNGHGVKEISTQTIQDSEPIYDSPPDIIVPSDIANSSSMNYGSEFIKIEDFQNGRVDDGDSSYGSLEGAISSLPKHMQSPRRSNTPPKNRPFPRTNPCFRNSKADFMTSSSALINPPPITISNSPSTACESPANADNNISRKSSHVSDDSIIVSPPNPIMARVPPPHGLPEIITPPISGRNIPRNKSHLQEMSRPLSMSIIPHKDDSFSSNDSRRSNSQKSATNLRGEDDIMKLPVAQPSTASSSIDGGIDSFRFDSLPNSSFRGVGSGAPPSPPGSGERLISLDLAWCQLDPIECGLTNKLVSVPNLLLWSKDQISKPLLLSKDASLKKLSTENFKPHSEILIHTGDKKSRSDKEKLDLSIVQRGWQYSKLRDEIYMQIMKQLVQNPSLNSLQLGWELLCVCLSFFPPSKVLHPFVESFIDKHIETLPSPGSVSDDDDFFMDNDAKCPKWFPKEKAGAEYLPVIADMVYSQVRVAQRRLKRIKQTGARKGTQNITEEELNSEKNAILSPGVFGSTLEDIMDQQSKMVPKLRVPWIQDMLSRAVLRLDGQFTEGIFRIPGDLDKVHHLKGLCDTQKQNVNADEEIDDPNVPASLLKLWLRELYDPIIPEYLYRRCLDVHNSIEDSLAVVDQLPNINQECLKHLVAFLQKFTAPKSIEQTKMDVPNLAMVMAPNILRSTATDPETIYEETRPQMYFLSNLIRNLDTSDFNDYFM